MRKIILDLKLSVRRKDTDISHMEKHYTEKFETEINKLKEENRKFEEINLSILELDTDSEMEDLKKTISMLKSNLKKLEKKN